MGSLGAAAVRGLLMSGREDQSGGAAREPGPLPVGGQATEDGRPGGYSGHAGGRVGCS